MFLELPESTPYALAPAQLSQKPEAGEGGDLACGEGGGPDGEGDGGLVRLDLQQQDQGGEEWQGQHRGTHLGREISINIGMVYF